MNGVLSAGASVFGAIALLAYSKETASADARFSQSDSFNAYDSLFRKYGLLRQVPWRWLKAIAWIESDLGQEPSVRFGLEHPTDAEGSVSKDGQSYGIMQLTLPTANRRRVRPGTTVRDLNTPEIAIDVAARYLRELTVFYFAGDREGAIRAYNGGPGWKSSSAKALAQTATYYDYFQKRLQLILAREPGDELERG